MVQEKESRATRDCMAIYAIVPALHAALSCAQERQLCKLAYCGVAAKFALG